MSQENVEIVRASAVAYNRGDLDALMDLYDPEVEFVTLLLGNHHGRLDPDELIDAGDKVIAVAHLGGAGAASGIALDDRIAFVATLKDGLIVRQQTFRNKAEALEAAGLRE